MSKKEDLKLVFDFIADFLREEKPVVEKHLIEERVNKVEPKKTKSDKNIEHMLEIMKRVDVMDGVRKTAPVIPPTERDEDGVVAHDNQIIGRHKNETGRGLGHLKKVLDESKVFNDLLSASHPIVDSTEKPGGETEN